MSAIPNVNFTIRNGALGILPSSSGQDAAVVGISSLGTVNTVYSFGSADLSAVTSTIGEGPGPELVALLLSTGGGTVYFVPIANTTAGAVGSVTHVGTGTDVVTPSGTPVDSFNVLLTVTAGAASIAAGGATVTVSLDGGTTTGPSVAIPTSGILPLTYTNGVSTGVTMTFAAAETFVVGDTYACPCTEPSYTTPGAQAAITALAANPNTWKFVHVAGRASSVANSVTMATAVATTMATLVSSKRFCRAFVESAFDTDANVVSGWASFSSTLVGAGGGGAYITSPLHGHVLHRGAQWVVSMRLKQIDPSVDVGEFDLGPIAGIVSIDRDENITPALDAARLNTLRTITGSNGFYITNCHMMDTPTGDFNLAAHAFVLDVVCTVMYTASLKFLNSKLRVNPAGNGVAAGKPGAPGTIDERDAQRWENYVNKLVNQAAVNTGYASATDFSLSRTDLILSTSTIHTKERVTPDAYAKDIEVDIGLSNPALGLS